MVHSSMLRATANSQATDASATSGSSLLTYKKVIRRDVLAGESTSNDGIFGTSRTVRVAGTIAKRKRSLDSDIREKDNSVDTSLHRDTNGGKYKRQKSRHRNSNQKPNDEESATVL